jgi:hypothetical protein
MTRSSGGEKENEHGSGHRFTGRQAHAFIVMIVIASMIIGLMIKIIFF